MFAPLTKNLFSDPLMDYEKILSSIKDAENFLSFDQIVRLQQDTGYKREKQIFKLPVPAPSSQLHKQNI